MSKLIMLSGLPASGKSTRAKEIVLQGNWVRVNRDLLRTMLHFEKYNGKNEGITVEVEKAIALNALKNGYNVVVDDTNLNPKNQPMWRQIAEAGDATFVHERIDTDWATCIVRDEDRKKKQVGEHVIKNMGLQYGLIPKPPKAFVLCDLDGTLCEITHRLRHVQVPEGQPKDWKSFFDGIPLDEPREETIKILNNYIDLGHNVIFVSARPEDYRTMSEVWINKHFPRNYFTLIMRKKSDTRPDTDVKQEMFNAYFKDKYAIETVLDDRPSVIRMWKSNGLDVIDCGKGVEF